MLLHWKSVDRAVADRWQLACQFAVGRRHQQRIRFGARPPSHNLIGIHRDLVVNSRGVSVVVAQDPAQPFATLYSFGTTSFRNLRKQ
jgi:hypothetical protein